MAKYRKKPVVIEAALFDGTLIGEPDGKGGVLPGTEPNWLPPSNRRVISIFGAREVPAGELVRFQNSLWIGTLEGAHEARPGDMILRGVQGEIYPCKPEIFAATYEAVADAVTGHRKK